MSGVSWQHFTDIGYSHIYLCVTIYNLTQPTLCKIYVGLYPPTLLDMSMLFVLNYISLENYFSLVICTEIWHSFCYVCVLN